MGSFARRLLHWYRANRRDLPWRRTTDPWAIWVSEVMLQQTRVEVVADAFLRLVDRYPTPERFARVTDAELLEAWQGLGYYRRARLLRDGAAQVVAEHGGEVPGDPEALGRLRGVGEYTRGALASIAFGVAEPAIDGNVERVIARHRAILTDVKTAAGRRQIRAVVEAELDRRRPGDFNQALMELGATVCAPRTPRCDSCPIAADCEGLAGGLVSRLPKLRKPKASVPVAARAALIRSRGGVLAAEIPTGEVNQGQLELPGPGVLRECEGGRELAASIHERFGAAVSIGDELGSVRHGITHHRITLTIHRGTLRGRRGPNLRAAPPDAAVWSTPSRKAFRALHLAE